MLSQGSAAPEDRKIQFNKKRYLQELYNNQIEEFKKSEEELLTLHPVSHFSQSYSTQQVTYTKMKRTVGINKDTGRIFIIKKNGVPISFTWETKPENIKKAVSYGIFKPESLTGQVLHAIGSYRTSVLERIYLGGIISNKYEEKKVLLDFWEKRIELLQPLECLINSAKTSSEIDAIFDNYIEKITEYKNSLKENPGISSFKKYDSDIQEKLEKFLDDDIKKIKALRALRASSPASLITELPVLMIQMTKQIQGINQNLTHARLEGELPQSLLRGKFNDACEDVMKVIYHYEPDLHNTVLPEHQGDFSVSTNEKIYLEFSATDTKALAAICQIEGADKIKYEDGGYRLEKDGKKQQDYRIGVYVIPDPLITTKWISWSFHTAFKMSEDWIDWGVRIAFFIANVVTGLVLTPFDIVRGFVGGVLGGIFNWEIESWVALFKLNLKKELPDTYYSTIAKDMQLKQNRPVVFQVTLSLGQSIAALGKDIFKSASIVLKKIVLELPDFIKDDYYVGGRGEITEKSPQEIMNQFFSDIKKINVVHEEVRELSLEKNPEEEKKAEKKEERHFALTPYHLSPGEWEDIFNAIPRGFYTFVESVLHPIHVRNPMIGLIYNVFYICGGLSVLFPDKMPLPDFYKNFSHNLGEQMSHSVTGQAVSSAVTQAQSAALVADAIFYGPSSILGKTFHTLEESIVDCVLIILLAREIGVLLREMPGIGKMIEEETGKASSLGLITFGGKFAIVLHELFESGEAKPTNEKEFHELIGKIKTDHSDLISEFKQENQKEINKTFFLTHLIVNTHSLPFLPNRTKHELLRLSEKLLEELTLITAVENMLYPEPPRSIASRTAHIIADYLLILIRMLCSPLTGNIKKPWRDLLKKSKKNGARVLRGLHKAGSFLVLVLYAGIYSPLRAISDGFFNGILARAEGWIRGERHSLSAVTTEVSSRISSTYQRLGDFISPTKIYKNVTHRDPHVVMTEALKKDLKEEGLSSPAPGLDDNNLRKFSGNGTRLDHI
ncbi:MAG: hypothetical protein K0R24_907 [Gammaproteobacteria bacterium]|jgi:hypothetical protein|nr:hypothetical protein [Gammaproteobacteria bacterium]